MTRYRRYFVALALALFTGGLGAGHVHAAIFLITDQSSTVLSEIDDNGGQFGRGSSH